MGLSKAIFHHAGDDYEANRATLTDTGSAELIVSPLVLHPYSLIEDKNWSELHIKRFDLKNLTLTKSLIIIFMLCSQLTMKHFALSYVAPSL